MKLCTTSFLFAALFSVAFHAHGAPGNLDASFAGTGTTRIGFGFAEDHASAVAVQADGKLVVAGSSGQNFFDIDGIFSVVRYGTDNLPDPSFGFGGKVITPVSAGLDDAGANAVKVQADGKIVVAGYAYTSPFESDFILVRYNPDGSLDTTFGTVGTGIVHTGFGQIGAEANALAIQPDGRLLVAGGYFNGAGGVDFILARYNTNGTLDPSFGGIGKVGKAVQGVAWAKAIALQSDGKILVAGGYPVVTLLRYATNGTLDSTFGPDGNGQVSTTVPPGVLSSAVAIQSGNNTPQNPDKIVVAGYTFDTSGHANFAVLRYNLNGTLDPSINGTGIVTNAVGPGESQGQAILMQGSGFQPRKIIVAGLSSSVSGRRSFALARYNANGSFDTTFNGTGTVITPIGPNYDEAHAVAFQAGKIVAVGFSLVNAGDTDFALARYNSDGSLDTTFDGDGIITTGVADRPAPAKAVAIQTDGKTVVAGYAETGVNEEVFALTRLNPDGSPDFSFGLNGKVTTSFGAAGARGNAVVIQPDGKIVAAGFANTDFAVVRYDTNGTPDVSFGVNGIVTTSIGAGNDVVNAIALQPDGKIVVAGSSFNGANLDFAVVRYTTNGIPDTSFSGDGKATIAIGTSDDSGLAVKMQADGKIVVAGTSVIGTSHDFAMVRYHTDGLVDTSFGSLGRVATDIAGGSHDLGQSVAIQPNGRILVGGLSSSGPITFAVVRYTTNGLPDTSFDGDGKVTTQIGIGLDYGYAMALQNDGKIVMAGASTTGESQFAAVRYTADGSLDNSYGTGGKVIAVFDNGGENIGYALVLDSLGRAVIAGDAGGIFGVARLQGDPLLKIRSIVRRTDGEVLLEGLGTPGVAHTLQASPGLSPGFFGSLGTVTPDGTGQWQYQDTGAAGLPTRFYRLSLP
jgi:uncharacterized delta-60 repeat protein